MTTARLVDRRDHLAPRDVRDVLALTQIAGDADGAYPLSEHVVLHVRHGGEAPAVHLLIRDPANGELVGYAHVDTTDRVAGASAELVVHPMHRRRGFGRALVDAALVASAAVDPRGRLRLWAHGDHPSATALAQSLGFERWRVLWQLRRSLFAPVPVPELPPEVRLRPFAPGHDEQDWLDLNNRAFADHPEQGRWTLHDLEIREQEPWFDPEGFILAEERTSGRLVGFHWTKVHGEVHRHQTSDGARPHAHDPIGEVYVLGVDPSMHGSGLGSALTLAGLRYLRSRGLDQAMLYVDESNTAAVRLYERLGFARWTTDVCFRKGRAL